MKLFESEINESFKQGRTPGQFVFLNQKRYDFSLTLSILSCTLFSQVTETQMESVSFGLNDFYHISDWSVEAHQEAHQADLEWLNREISSIACLKPSCKVVVFTHYYPLISKNIVDPKHRHSNISSGFMTNLLGKFCWKQEVIKL